MTLTMKNLVDKHCKNPVVPPKKRGRKRKAMTVVNPGATAINAANSKHNLMKKERNNVGNDYAAMPISERKAAAKAAESARNAIHHATHEYEPTFKSPLSRPIKF